MCVDCNVMICVGAMTEVEALKQALAEAKEKAAKEQAVGVKTGGSRVGGPKLCL